MLVNWKNIAPHVEFAGSNMHFRRDIGHKAKGSPEVCESWAKGPWKGFPLRKPLGMQLTVSAKVFFWNGEREFFSG